MQFCQHKYACHYLLLRRKSLLSIFNGYNPLTRIEHCVLHLVFFIRLKGQKYNPTNILSRSLFDKVKYTRWAEMQFANVFNFFEISRSVIRALLLGAKQVLYIPSIFIVLFGEKWYERSARIVDHLSID
jgi:hypothetical protein